MDASRGGPATVRCAASTAAGGRSQGCAGARNQGGVCRTGVGARTPRAAARHGGRRPGGARRLRCAGGRRRRRDAPGRGRRASARAPPVRSDASRRRRGGGNHDRRERVRLRPRADVFGVTYNTLVRSSQRPKMGRCGGAPTAATQSQGRRPAAAQSRGDHDAKDLNAGPAVACVLGS